MTRRTLTVQAVARLLDRHPETIRRWCRSGQLDAVRGPDGWLIAAEALASMVQRGSNAQSVQQVRTRTDTDNCDGGYVHGVHRVKASTPAPPPTEGTMPDMTDFLALAEAATHIGRSTRTVRRWVQQGDLPRTRRVKTRLYVHPGDLEAMVQPANPEAFAAAAAS